MGTGIPPGGCHGSFACPALILPACLPAPQRMFAPALPSDLLVNVYINLNKICLTVYQLHSLQPNSTKVSRTPSTSYLPPLPFPCPHGALPCSPEGLTRSGALLPRTSALLEAPCSTALGPCCKYTAERGAPECSPQPNPLHLGMGYSGTLPSPHSEWGSQRLEVSHVHKVESVIPWLNDALVFFTVSLQLCQQLKDKVGTQAGGRGDWVKAGSH